MLVLSNFSTELLLQSISGYFHLLLSGKTSSPRYSRMKRNLVCLACLFMCYSGNTTNISELIRRKSTQSCKNTERRREKTWTAAYSVAVKCEKKILTKHSLVIMTMYVIKCVRSVSLQTWTQERRQKESTYA